MTTVRPIAPDAWSLVVNARDTSNTTSAVADSGSPTIPKSWLEFLKGVAREMHRSDEKEYYFELLITIQFPPAMVICTLLLLSIPGILGNVLLFRMSSLPKLRCHSYSVFLAVVSVTDTFSLIYLNTQMFMKMMGQEVFMMLPSVHYCRALALLSGVSQHASAWILTVFSLDRFIATVFPLKRKVICTVRNARISCAVVLAVLFAGQVPIVIQMHRIPFMGRYLCADSDDNYDMSTNFELLIFSVLPCLGLLAINTHSLLSIKMSMKHRLALQPGRKEGKFVRKAAIRSIRRQTGTLTDVKAAGKEADIEAGDRQTDVQAGTDVEARNGENEKPARLEKRACKEEKRDREANADAKCRETANTDAKGKETANTDAKGKETANTDAKGKETANTDAKGKETANTDAKGKETANTDVKGKETANTDAKGKETANTDVKGEETANTDAKGKETANTDARGREVNTDAKGKETAITDAKGKETANTDARGREAADGDLEAGEREAEREEAEREAAKREAAESRKLTRALLSIPMFHSLTLIPHAVVSVCVIMYISSTNELHTFETFLLRLMPYMAVLYLSGFAGNFWLLVATSKAYRNIALQIIRCKRA